MREEVEGEEEEEEKRIERVLLTGATGYLGIHILYELLSQSSSSIIYCPMRLISKPAGDSSNDNPHHRSEMLNRIKRKMEEMEMEWKEGWEEEDKTHPLPPLLPFLLLE